MPSLIAVSATMLPIAPRPMMPSVRPGSSTPANCFLPSSTRRSRSGASGVERRDVSKRRYRCCARREQRREHELLHGVGVRARRIEHRRAALRHRATTGMLLVPAPARLIARTRRRDRHRVHVARTHENSQCGRSTASPTRYRASGKRRNPMLAIGLSVRISYLVDMVRCYRIDAVPKIPYSTRRSRIMTCGGFSRQTLGRSHWPRTDRPFSPW